MLAVYTCCIGVLALHLLRLTRNRNAKVADIGDILQWNEVLYQYLCLIERLLVGVEVEMLICLYGLEVNLLEVIQCAADSCSASCCVAVGIARVLIVYHLWVYFQQHGV